MESYLQLLFAIVLPVAGGWSTSVVMGGQVRRPGGAAWYQRIRKPVWTPRNSVFAPVWAVLYTTMGTASYLVFKSTDDFDKVKLPLALYGIQLLLNFCWTPIFFGLHWIKTAFLEMLLLDAASAACALSFYRRSPTAALLMAPYLAWLTFASSLNYTVWRMNEPRKLHKGVSRGGGPPPPTKVVETKPNISLTFRDIFVFRANRI